MLSTMILSPIENMIIKYLIAFDFVNNYYIVIVCTSNILHVGWDFLKVRR